MLRLLLSLLVVACPAAWASQPAPERGADMGLFSKDDETTEEEKSEEQKRAEAEEERKRKEKLARVLVLEWPDTSTNHNDETLRREVRSRIARPEAMFFPEVDLYQNGRKVQDRTVRPAEQPAIVPDSNVPGVLAAIDQIAGVPWDALTPSQWGLKANELKATAELLWFIDRVEVREPIFLLYAQIGRAAENQNHPGPPYYVQIGPEAVNYYWYHAALLAYQEPALMSKITDQELYGSVNYYLEKLQQGRYPTFKIDFQLENQFNAETFSNEYELYVNGLPVELDNNGQMDVYLGRSDIYLKRKDTGHGLSERLELTLRDEKIWFVRDAARKKMGIEFIDQLFLHKNECYPELDGDILNYLAIYAKLHNKAEIYVAVPENGNPNRVWIWRYDRDRAMLSLVRAAGGGFPVRFAFVVSGGMMFNGASVEIDSDISDEGQSSVEQVTDSAGIKGRSDFALRNAFIPINFELRGHWNRLMVNVGAEFGFNSEDEANWIERYYLPKHLSSTAAIAVPEPEGQRVDEDGNTIEAYHQTAWNRYLYMGAGVVLGRDAGIGFGPRFAVRTGWTNLPHAWQSTGHFGWAIQPPVPEFGKDRVRPLLDADFRGGISYSLKNSLQTDIAKVSESEARVMPVFGLTVGLGLTF